MAGFHPYFDIQHSQDSRIFFSAEIYNKGNFLIHISFRFSVAHPIVAECEQKDYVTRKFPRTLPGIETLILQILFLTLILGSSCHKHKNLTIGISWSRKPSAPVQCPNRINAQITEGRSFREGKIVAQYNNKSKPRKRNIGLKYLPSLEWQNHHLEVQ